MKGPKSVVFTNFLIAILAFLPSCSGLNKSESLKASQKALRLGQIASELDKRTLVIFQSKNDQYWFAGGGQGVYSYDGESLVRFTVNDGLCSNTVLGIQEDQFGNIYFDTSIGVSKFDGHKFTTLAVISSDSVQNEWKLAPHDLWFRMGTDKNGPYRYDGKALYQLAFPKPDLAEVFYAKYPHASYSPYGIYTIYKDRKGSIWFGTASLGACRYDGESISWLYEQQLTETPNGGDFGIRSIIEDKPGYFWFCNTRYRYEISPNSTEKKGTNYINYRKENGVGTSTNSGEKDFPYFMSIVEDDGGDLWMVTYDNGVWRNNGEELIHYPIKEGEKDVLLFSIYQDNQGILWLGTHQAGAYKFNGKTFEKFNP